MHATETARFILKFAAILADEAERHDLKVLACLLRDAEAEAATRCGPPGQLDLDDDPPQWIIRRLQ